MNTVRKAIGVGTVAGLGGIVANPFSPAINFGLQHTGLPPDASEPLGTFLGTLLYGFVMAAVAYIIPNASGPTGSE